MYLHAQPPACAAGTAGCGRGQARAAGVQVGVVSQLRYGPAVARVKRALESGALGRITRCDLYMKYFRPQSYYDSGTWRGTQAMDGGGALMNQGIHGVDLVRYLMGPADSIYALSGTLVRDIEVEDTLTAVVAWHCGAQGVIQASVGDYPGFPRRIELNGESGTIILEEDRIVKWEVAGDSAYHIYEQEPAPEVRSHSEAGAIDPSGHVAQLRNFIDAVRGDAAGGRGRRPQGTGAGAGCLPLRGRGEARSSVTLLPVKLLGDGSVLDVFSNSVGQD